MNKDKFKFDKLILDKHLADIPNSPRSNLRTLSSSERLPIIRENKPLMSPKKLNQSQRIPKRILDISDEKLDIILNNFDEYGCMFFINIILLLSIVYSLSLQTSINFTILSGKSLYSFI